MSGAVDNETSAFIEAVNLVEDAGYVVLHPSSARIAAREGGVKVRALEWKLREARSMIGLYSVRQLSENVWQTMWNGTEIARWSPTELLATSRAQSHYEAAIRSAIVTGEGK